MKSNRTLFALLILGSLTAATPICAGADFFYAQITSTQSYTTFVGPTPITGLGLTLPAASKDFNAAVVTLNLPNLFLSDNTSTTTPMSAIVQIVAPFSPSGVLVAMGGIGCDNLNVKTSGLKPLTLVLEVPLGTTSQPVGADWASNGTSTVTTQTFASISAILVRK